MKEVKKEFNNQNQIVMFGIIAVLVFGAIVYNSISI